MNAVDLSTTYLGLPLDSPIAASSSPLTSHLDTLAQLEEAGASAVVLPSLFEEDVLEASFGLDRAMTAGTESYPEALTYLPELDATELGPQRHLELVAKAKQSLRIPVIASVNGTTHTVVRYAAELADAGADAIELNVYFVSADPHDTAESVENRYLHLVESVRSAIDVPLAVKVGPYFTAFAAMARRLADAGADGLVLFNRFYQPDLDLDSLQVTPTVTLSSSADLRLPLRWIAILHGRVGVDLAASGGVHTAEDVAKALLAGASVAMTTAALLVHGPNHIRDLRRDLTELLATREYHSARQLLGSMSSANVDDPDAYERANYVAVLQQASHIFD